MNEYGKDLLLGIKLIKKDDIDKLNNKTILFTGSTGLIGRYFIDSVMTINKDQNTNIKIIAVARNLGKAKSVFSNYLEDKNFIIYVHDVCDKFTYEDSVDFIVHAASPANPYFFSNNPVETMKANFLGTLNLLDFSKEKKVKKFVYISSGEVYGAQVHDGSGYKEEDPGVVESFRVRSCYTESKRASETLIASYFSEYNVESVVLRMCYVYGPTYSKTDDRVVFQFIRNVLDKTDIIMKSEGTQKRSYMYVSDAVNSIIHSLTNYNGSQVFNVSNPEIKVTIKEIAETLVSLSNNKSKLKIEKPLSKESMGYSPFKDAIQDSSKLNESNFKAKVSFKDGLKRVLDVKGYE